MIMPRLNFGRRKAEMEIGSTVRYAPCDSAAKVMSPPNTVRIDGTAYAINTDFRVWLEVDGVLNGEGSEGFRLARALTLVYPILPHDMRGAIRGMLDFFAGGSEKLFDRKAGVPNGGRVFDLRQDFEYVWSAFISEYGIDLTECNIHWWRFKALLSALGNGSRLAEIVTCRCVDMTKIKDTEMRKRYAEMRRRYRLRDRRSAEERDREFAAELGEIFEEV